MRFELKRFNQRAQVAFLVGAAVGPACSSAPSRQPVAVPEDKLEALAHRADPAPRSIAELGPFISFLALSEASCAYATVRVDRELIGELD